MSETDTPAAPPPLLLVKGDATPEEVAAVVAVLQAAAGGEATAPRRPAPGWSAHHRKVRSTFHHGAGGWRSSGLPR